MLNEVFELSELIVGLLWFLLFFGGGIFLAYRRIDLRTSTVAIGAALLAYLILGNGHWIWYLLLIAAFALIVIPNLVEYRREKITKPLLAVYRKMLPSMSDTEREALEAGNVWWDGELFSGMPEWDRLISYPAPKLSEEEQAFLDGPCEQLCHMLDDWEICHERADMPKEVWDYIIEQRFFAMIIPKQYGGLEFSAYANAAVITKLASRSPTASSTIGVPNSLGPAELLLHYGTEEQKNHYLLEHGFSVIDDVLLRTRTGLLTWLLFQNPCEHTMKHLAHNSILNKEFRVEVHPLGRH